MPLHILRCCSRAAVLGPLGVAFMDLLPKMKPITEDTFDWAPAIKLLQRPMVSAHLDHPRSRSGKTGAGNLRQPVSFLGRAEEGRSSHVTVRWFCLEHP